ncbi:hypothetical protein ASE75_11395 [Sphingomonas sp. Leaf17]|uniref:outer membrane protein n=1 Tax=Sphingomonas sp. Leaf17 TaxID=1735683 RepID=UPI0006FF1B50|nr:outer membrane beta-barrel protein [Sphingomonas sp. Leaf17]KQM63696.1 hypothetical protein ASE75_11395 [Sphingomonas sp. Leaf17]
MRNHLLASAAGIAALVAFAAPAAAQDMVEDAPFSGVYVGGSFGFDAQPNDVGETIEFDRNLDGVFRDTVRTGTGANAFAPGFCNGAARSSANLNCRNDRDDMSYSARVGADHQSGNIVVGVIGEFGKSEITDSVTAFSSTPAFYTMTRSLDWEASIRGRAGFAANKTLFFGSFGAGYARIKNDFTTSNTANVFSSTGDDNRWGINAGGGIEQKIGKNFSIGVEYLYHQYQDDDYRVRAGGNAGTPFTNATNGGTTAGTDFRRNFDYFRWHSVRGTASFRF